MSRKNEIRAIALNFPERIDEIERAEQRFETEQGRYSSFFPPNAIPKRFRSKPHVCIDGREMNVATIRDVVKWSMSGKRAKGSYLDDKQPSEKITCQSGFCE